MFKFFQILCLAFLKEILNHILIVKSFVKLNVFVKVDLVWFSENLQLTITREPKVKVIKEISDEEIFNAYCGYALYECSLILSNNHISRRL